VLFRSGAVSEYVYCATVVSGSLTNERSIRNIESRYLVCLRRNKFLREHGKNEFQWSVMGYFYLSTFYGLKNTTRFLLSSLEYQNNVLIGSRNWFNTIFKLLRKTGRKKGKSRYD
jgi:hypothetical protein